MRSSGGAGPEPTPDGYSENELDYLLSAGGLGGSQEARIFDTVARIVRQRERRNLIHRVLSARWAKPIIAVVAASAVCLVVWAWKAEDPSPFRSKGRATTEMAPTIEVDCLRATLAACPRGSILAFSVRGATTEGFVTVYLVPSQDTQPVWLLLSEPTSMRAAGGGDLLARGARVPDTLEPGSYTVVALMTKRPQSREQALDPAPAETIARARFNATVPW